MKTKTKEKTNKKLNINKKDKIAKIVGKYPDAAEVFMMYGLACVGCFLSPHETIEQGAKRHGMTNEEIDQMIKDANSLIEA